MNREDKALGLAFAPSWLSGLLAVTIAMGVVLGTAGFSQYRGSQLQLLNNSETQEQSIDQSYKEVDSTLARNGIISNVPLMIFWGGVGFVVYIFITNITAAFKRALDFENRLEYAHADRQLMIHTTIAQAVFRLTVLIVWFLYLRFTLHILLPYVIALAYSAAVSLRWESALYLSGGILLLALAIHLHVVLFRLIMLKPRIFGQAG